MPRVQLPNGQIAEFPDGMDHAHIAAAIQTHMVGKGVAGGDAPELPVHAPAPSGLTNDDKRGAFQRTVDDVFANNDKSGSEALRPVGNIGRRAVRTLTQQVTSIPGQIAGVTSYTGPRSKGTDKAAKAVGATGAPTVESSDINSPIPGYVDTARTKGATQAATDVAGDLLAAELGGKAIEAAAEPTAATLNATGRLTRKVGAYGVRKGLGLESPRDAMGADAASAITRNRVVGTSPKSLLRKVEARVEPMSQARDAILSRSQAPTTDVAPDVTQAFADAMSPKIDPKTGAAQPGSVARATTSRRVIQEVTDPETGRPTGDLKDSHLSPLEMSRLQRNVYDMTDYVNPESDLANTGLKATGAKLRDRIRSAAPEANTMTDALHDLMGAREQLRPKAEVPEPELHGVGHAGLRTAKRLATGAVTAAGAVTDAVGSGMQSLAGRIRSTSPVGTASPTKPGEHASTPRQLPSETIANADDHTPVDTGSPVGPSSPARPVYPASRPLLSRVAGPDTTGPGPGNVVSGEVTRIEPTVTRPRTQQVAPDQPGYLPPRGGRRLIATPEGIRPEPITLDVPRSQPRLDTPAGNRRSLVQRLRDQAQRQGDAHEAGIRASRAKLDAIPEGQPPRIPDPAKVAGGKTRAARAKLSTQIKAEPPASTPSAPKPPTNGRLPDPTDIDGWEALVDEGKARYNTRTHTYDYIGQGGRK